MTSPLDRLSEHLKKRLKRAAHPEKVRPMLATLTNKRFSDSKWVFERKLDGERCIASKRDGRVRLMSRNKKGLNTTYPELVAELERQAADNFVIDGEIVAFEGNLTSFSRLQNRMQIKDPAEALEAGVAVYYYIFDIVYLHGYDITQLPLKERKSILKELLDFDGGIHLRFTVHRNENGEQYYEEACEQGWEGLIAKDSESGYVHRRSRSWLKFKCVNQQEFVIGGFTDPKGNRVGFGALLLGYYDQEELVYAGMVGTGFDDETLRNLHEKMAEMECREPSFARSDDELPEHYVHWVKPKLVAEVGFTEWTPGGKLRHPRFLGLRDDKPPGNIHRETGNGHGGNGK